MDFSIVPLANERVPHFMQGLKQDQCHVKPDDVVRSQHPLCLGGKLPKICHSQLDRPNQGKGEYPRPCHTDYQVDNRLYLVQEAVRIPQRDTQKHDAEQFGAHLLLPAFLVAFEQTAAVYIRSKTQKIAEVQLGQQLDNVFLPRCLVRIFLQAFLPDIFHAPGKAQTGDKFVGRRTQSKELVIEGIVQYIPLFSPEKLFPGFHSGF